LCRARAVSGHVSAARSRRHRHAIVTLFVGCLTLSGCSERVPSGLPQRPLEAIPNILSNTGTAAGAVLRGSASATVEFKESPGKWSRSEVSPWPLEAIMSSRGVAVLNIGALPEPPSTSSSTADLQDYMRFMTPIIALAGDARTNALYTGFTRSAVDSSGATVQVTAVANSAGTPVSEILIRRNGVRIAHVRLHWAAESGGFVLVRQTATLFRGSSSEAFAVAIVRLAYSSIDPQGLANRLAQRLFRYTVSAVLPKPLHAQDCGWEVADVVVGGALLIATAPATATGAGAIAWLGGWYKWTRELIQAVDVCDPK
jgi:hypothetical protein